METALPQHTLAQATPVQRPPCPQCGAQMMVMRIQPHTPGIDERTYQCAKCGFVEKLLVKNK